MQPLATFDRKITAAISALELPLIIETLLLPFGAIHGYAGGMVGLPCLWLGGCHALGMRYHNMMR